MKSKRNCPVCQYEPENGHAPDCPRYVGDAAELKRIMSRLGKMGVVKRHEGKSKKQLHEYYKHLSDLATKARQKTKEKP